MLSRIVVSGGLLVASLAACASPVESTVDEARGANTDEANVVKTDDAVVFEAKLYEDSTQRPPAECDLYAHLLIKSTQEGSLAMSLQARLSPTSTCIESVGSETITGALTKETDECGRSTYRGKGQGYTFTIKYDPKSTDETKPQCRNFRPYTVELTLKDGTGTTFLYGDTLEKTEASVSKLLEAKELFEEGARDPKCGTSLFVGLEGVKAIATLKDCNGNDARTYDVKKVKDQCGWLSFKGTGSAAAKDKISILEERNRCEADALVRQVNLTETRAGKRTTLYGR